MKTSLVKIFCIVVIVLLLIWVSFFNKEHFSAGNDDVIFQIVDTQGGRILNEFSNFNGFQEVIDPVDPNKVVKFNKLNNTSSFVYNRVDVNTNTDFTLGFYFKPSNNNSPYNYLFSAEDKNDNEVMRVDIEIEHIKIVYEENELKIPRELDILSSDDTEYSYLVLKGDIKNEEFVPKLHIVYNGKNYEMTLKNRSRNNVEKFYFWE